VAHPPRARAGDASLASDGSRRRPPVHQQKSPLRQKFLSRVVRVAEDSQHMKFDFEKFYQAVNAKRTARAASWRQVAREVGIGKSTLARMSQNKRPDADGLAALSFWAELNPADFVFSEALVEQPAAPALRGSAASDDCPAARGGVITA
jgi:hypothetical protein